MILKLVGFCFFILIQSLCFGQKYAFVEYSTEEGLPQSQVTSICQDNKGYLWVGTLGGLAKFSGSKFITYSSVDGLLNNRVESLDFFDETIWVGHEGGVTYVKNGRIKNIAFSGTGNDRSRSVSKIIRFHGDIVVCSNGGGLYKIENNGFVKIQLKNQDFERVRDAYVYNNQLYLATKGGVLASKDLKNFSVVQGLGAGSFSGIDGRGDKLVFATYNDGIFIRDMKTFKQTYYSAEKLKYSIYGCYLDRSNQIWLNTLDGVVRIEEKGNLFFFDEDNGMPVNMTSCIFNDNANNIWIGSQGKGIFRFPSSDFKYFDQSNGFPSDLIVTGFEDKFGDYYFGTYDKGIVKQTKTGQISPIFSSELTIWSSLSNCDNKHWFGGSGGLISVDKNGNVRSFNEENTDALPGSKITALYKLTGNSMYVGGSEGVALYKSGKFTLLGSDGDGNIGTVRDFGLLQDTLYCASNLGLFIYVNGKFKLISPSNQVVYNIEIDQYNVLWYGTESGLFRYKNGKVSNVHLLNDLGSNYTNFLNFRNGKMFVGTNNGLFILTNLSADKPQFKRYGISEGIIDLETNLNSGFFDSQNRFWFGTASGLVSYQLDNEDLNDAKPRVHLLSILLNYQSFDYEKYADSLNGDGIPISLNLPNSKNNLIFEMDGVSLVNQKNLGFQYKLQGLRDDWSTTSENPTITFTSLPPGDYVFHVRVVDVDGRLSKEIKFPFVINEAFYKTWWFITMEVVAFTGIMILFFRFRIRRIAEQNEKEKLDFKSRLLALEQQSMNASMNRHFIFNSLNSIQYFINTQDKLSANKYLTNFAQLIRKNLDSATAKDNVVSLEEELERLRLYLSLESMRFKDRFEYQFNISNEVDAESIMIPPMIMQPFIENSIIHGILPRENKKGLIKVDVFIENGYLNIVIEDNGIGITESLKSKTHNFGDHRSQGMEITSKRIELIQKISKDDISLVGPEQIIGNNGLINGTRVLIKIPVFDLENQ